MSGFDTSVPHFSGIHSLYGGGVRDIESVMHRRLIAVRILIGVVTSLKIAHYSSVVVSGYVKPAKEHGILSNKKEKYVF